ncbi:antitoxin family protein [Pyrodictium abyssi]|uniref:antitoxin family protein n=1 Tax=Pyrodictium abyssi TaxID=54256 RepID=UPI0030C71B5E
MSRIIRVKYEKGVLRPLDSVEFREGEELLVKIVSAEEKRRILRIVPWGPRTSPERAPRPVHARC